MYTKGPYKSPLLATFDHLEEEGKEEVFDITVARVHNFSANGILVSNCGEEGLPAYGVCNLGSLNLANFVNEKDEMDTVIFEVELFLKQQDERWAKLTEEQQKTADAAGEELFEKLKDQPHE